MPPPLLESDEESPAKELSPPVVAKESTVLTADTKMEYADDEKVSNAMGEIKGEDEDEEGDDDDDEEVYIVESIVEHRADFEDGEMRYLIKWKGYEKKSDRTWETEGNLSGARDLLQEYWLKIGGRPLSKREKAAMKRQSMTKLKREAKLDSDTPPPSKKKRGGRRSAAADSDDDDAPKGLINAGDDEWKVPLPHPGAWDHQIQSIDTVERDPDGQLWAYLVWSVKTEDGRYRRSKAKLEAVYKAAPQKMLQFYENHLKFPDEEKPLV